MFRYYGCYFAYYYLDLWVYCWVSGLLVWVLLLDLGLAIEVGLVICGFVCYWYFGLFVGLD